MKLDTKTIILILAALVVCAGAYWFFFSGGGNDVPLTTTPATTGAQATFQSLGLQLGSISFDTNIFTDPRFASLVDLATPVAPESVGRTDPFAP